MDTKQILKTKAADDTLGILYFDLDGIQSLGKNFKNHDVEGIAGSIAKRGLLTPIGIDELSKENFDGNGRVEALQLLKSRSAEPPRKVIAKGGKWYVPVLTGVSFETEAERVAAAAALNRLNELGGYDKESQLEILQYLSTEGELDDTGYTDEDVSALLAKMTISDDDASDASDTVKGGIQVRESAQMSAMRQTQLSFTPEMYAEFLKLSVTRTRKRVARTFADRTWSHARWFVLTMAIASAKSAIKIPHFA